MSSDALRQAIKKGMQAAGWKQPSDDTLRQVETAVNDYLGDTANEAEKDTRREAAVIALNEIKLKHVRDADFMAEANALIKKAQG